MLAVGSPLSVPGAYMIVLDEAEAFAYVTCAAGVVQIDLSTFLVSNTVAVGGYGAAQLALDPTDTYLYVCAGSGSFGQAHKIDLSSFTVVGGALATSGGGGANNIMGIVVDPYGHYVYVVGKSASVVKIDKIDAAAWTLGTPLTVAGMTAIFSVWGLAIDATGSYAYVFADQLARIDLGSFAVAGVDSSISGIEDGISFIEPGAGDGLLAITQGNSETLVMAQFFPSFPPSYFAIFFPTDPRHVALGFDGYAYTSDWGTYTPFVSTISKADIGLGVVVGNLVTGTKGGNMGIAVKGHAPPIVVENNIAMLV
jgi:hypothetical protein